MKDLKCAGFVRPTVVRTLGLPRDFQLVVRGVEYLAAQRGTGRMKVFRSPDTDVRKVRADTPFFVRCRVGPFWQIRVHSVRHTLRAFVKWLLWRYKKDMQRLLGPQFEQPSGVPPVSMVPYILVPVLFFCLTVALWWLARRALDELRWQLWWWKFEAKLYLEALREG